MGKLVIIIFLAALIGIFISPVPGSCADVEKSMAELFETKCSSCHATDQAEQIHLSKRGFLDIIKRMVKKEGSDISEEEAKKIADFLGNPNRLAFKEQCLRCHGIGIMAEAHLKGRLTPETIKRMKKRGAVVTDKEAESFLGYPKIYYFPSQKPKSE